MQLAAAGTTHRIRNVDLYASSKIKFKNGTNYLTLSSAVPSPNALGDPLAASSSLSEVGQQEHLQKELKPRDGEAQPQGKVRTEACERLKTLMCSSFVEKMYLIDFFCVRNIEAGIAPKMIAVL